MSLEWACCGGGDLVFVGASLSWLSTLAPHARNLSPDKTLPTFRRRHPRPVLPGRVVPHVLLMAAGELCHPMAFGVLVKSGNARRHQRPVEVSRSTRVCTFARYSSNSVRDVPTGRLRSTSTSH